jgi:hypothetical protein
MVAAFPTRVCGRQGRRVTLGESCMQDISSNLTTYYRSTADPMSEPSAKNEPVAQQQIPEDLALEIRRLAHDLSNALEIIVQTSYLLNMAELKEPASDWLRMMDTGVTKALELNQQLREYIRLHTPR